MARTTLRKLRPVPLTDVRFDGGFWAPRIETNRRVTLPAEYEQCRKTGRLDASQLGGQPPGSYWMGDVGKWIEAAADSLAARPDPRLEALVEDAVARVIRGQRDDGYLYCGPAEPGKRWINLSSGHELYDAGHMMEAAVAHHQATGRRSLLDAMCRNANLLSRVFGRRKGQKRGYCGHPEVELALVKLYRATGEKRCLDLAEFFIDERGRRPNYLDLEAVARGEDPAKSQGPHEIFQTHLPVRKQKTAEGHAVRAMYLFSGMADVAAETGDRTLLSACRRLWKNVVERRMYVTGGVGSSKMWERFTFDYDLPNETAYAETCAAIALVFWAHRMLQFDGNAAYADVMERALYNGVLSGVSLDGRRFFYANPLTVYPPALKDKADPWAAHIGANRREWFGCACCPPNIARLLASLGGYVYSQNKNVIYLHLYAQGRGRILVNGQTVAVAQETEYPWNGKVTVAVELQTPARFTLALRIPGWCRRASLSVNGRKVEIKPLLRKGYAHVTRRWKAGDIATLDLAMPVERIEAHPRVRMDSGRVALQRGPVVYCLEEVDNGPNLSDISLLPNPALRVAFDSRLLGGVPVITGRGVRRELSGWDRGLYRPAGSRNKAVKIRAVPYCLWNNRKAGEMLVWIRR
jgi:uncharacterized protein